MIGPSKVMPTNTRLVDDPVIAMFNNLNLKAQEGKATQNTTHVFLSENVLGDVFSTVPMRLRLAQANRVCLVRSESR